MTPDLTTFHREIRHMVSHTNPGVARRMPPCKVDHDLAGGRTGCAQTQSMMASLPGGHEVLPGGVRAEPLTNDVNHRATRRP